MATLGGLFADADADKVLFDTIEADLRRRGIICRRKESCNDSGFALDIYEALITVAGLQKTRTSE